MGISPVSTTCSDRSDLCEISVKKYRKIEVNNEKCTESKDGYKCQSFFLPITRDGKVTYLPGKQRGSITLFPRSGGKKVKAPVFLPATKPSEISGFQQKVFDRAVSIGKPYYHKYRIVAKETALAMIRAKSFKSAEKIASQIGCPFEAVEVYLELAKDTGLSKHYDLAVRAAERIDYDPQNEGEVEAVQAEEIQKVAEQKRDKKLFRLVMKKISKVRGKKRQKELTSYLAYALIRAGFKQESVRWVQSNKEAFDLETRLDLQLKLGNIDAAIKAARSLNPRDRAYLFLEISKEHGRDGLLVDAIESAEKITDQDVRDKVFFAITDSMVKDKMRYLDAARVAKKISVGNYRRSLALSMVGGKTGSKETFRLAIEEANQLPGYLKQSRLASIAYHFSEAGLFKEAIETAKRVTNKERNRWALSQIVIEMVRKNKVDQAMGVVKRFLSKEKGHLVYETEFAEALAQKGHFDKALEIARHHTPKRGVKFVLQEISIEMAKAKRFNWAIAVAESIEDWGRAPALADVAAQME